MRSFIQTISNIIHFGGIMIIRLY